MKNSYSSWGAIYNEFASAGKPNSNEDTAKDNKDEKFDGIIPSNLRPSLNSK